MKKLYLFAFILLTYTSFAQIPKPQKNTYVNDYAGVLSKEDITELNKDIFKIEKNAKVQLAIVLVNKIPAAYDIQDFAVLIGKKWHVGKNKKGIVYVAAIKQRKQRIEVARSLDSIFTGAVSLEIMDAMKPAFKAGDYNGGLKILVQNIRSNLHTVLPQQVAAASSPAAATDGAAAPTQNATKENDTRDFWVGFLFFAGVILLIVIYMRRRNSKQREMQNFYNSRNANNPGYFQPGQGPQGYGAPGYMQPPPDHTVRNVLTGAALGAAAGYAARAIQDNIADNRHPDHPANNGNYNSAANDMANNDIYQNDDNKPSNWGSWGDSGGSSSDSSSYDSGFSDDSSSDSSSSSGGSSDW